jgi:hypothetical protein
MNPDLHAFLSRVPKCGFLFQPDFYKKCGEIIALGPDENKQKAVMGKYFPGRALPPSIDIRDELDLRFQQPVKPNELTKKWTKIAKYCCGLIVGPSGSGKVCSLSFCSYVPRFCLPPYPFSGCLRLQPFLIFLHLNASGACMPAPYLALRRLIQAFDLSSTL